MSRLTNTLVFGAILFLTQACGIEPENAPKTKKSESNPPSPEVVAKDDNPTLDVLPEEKPKTPIEVPVEVPIEEEDVVEDEVVPEGTDIISDLKIMNGAEEAAFNSSEYPYGVFVVEAYFLGCPYCNQNTQNVDELADEYASQDQVHVLDVSIDCRDSDYRNWISRHNPNHPVLNDCGGRSLLKNKLNISSYPTTVVLNCKGEEVYRTTGLWAKKQKDQLKAAIDLAVEDCSK